MLIVCAVFSLSLSQSVLADKKYNINYVLSDEREIYHKFIHKINSNNIIYTKLDINEVSKKTLNKNNTDIIITLGTKATKKALKATGNIPVLAVFITRKSYLDILKKYKNYSRRLFSAIYIDQPVSQQLKLIKAAFPKKTHIGVAISPDSRLHLPALIKTSSDLGLKVHIESLTSPDDIHRIIRKLSENNDMILAVQDSRIYNKYTIQNILMTTYHAGIPVIGYSKPYVKAGTLMSVYASVNNVAKHTSAIIKRMVKTKQLPRADYCKYYSIELNNQVAKSLGIMLDNKDVIKNRMTSINKEYPDE